MSKPANFLGYFGRSVAAVRMSSQQAMRCRGFSSTALYDLAVVGGGPGGYVAAIKASQLGLKTVCIEKRGTLGGTCLNVGCIPSKALLNISHKFHDAQQNFAKMGIKFEGKCTIDVAAMQQQKTKSVRGLTGGIEMLFKANKVTYEKAAASFVDRNTLQLDAIGSSTEASKTLTAKNIIIATGSESAPLPGGAVTPDESDILTSTGALGLQSAPKRLVVIGGGVIGLEMGSVWRRLGSEVIVVEFLHRLVPGIDSEVAVAFQSSLEKQGFKFKLSAKVTGVTRKAPGNVLVHVQDVKSGKTEDIDCDKVLLAVGRKPHIAGLKLEALGIQTDKGGRIVVDEHLKIPEHPHIYAIGDVVPGPMLAHKAEEEGIAAVEHIVLQGGHVNYSTIPSVVYTHPEVAGVGSTEDQLKVDGISYRRGFFPFGSNSRARTNDDFEGFVKVLTDDKSDRILGAWIIGPDAGELVQQLVLGMEYGASSEDIARTCHAHPTLSEAVKEACMSAFSKPIHNVQK